MLGDCRARKHHEQMGKSTHSTELYDSFKTLLETLTVKSEKPINMTAELKIG